MSDYDSINASLLSDILGGAGLSLESLEAQLDSLTTEDDAGASTSSDNLLSPKDIGFDSVMKSSIAANEYNITSNQSTSQPSTQSNLQDDTSDAWARSLAAFNSFAAEDFLKADSEKKAGAVADGLIGGLGLDDELEVEEYDVSGEVEAAGVDVNVVKGMSQIKGIMASDKRGAENAKAKVPPVSANSRPPNLPVPPQRQQQQQMPRGGPVTLRPPMAPQQMARGPPPPGVMQAGGRGVPPPIVAPRGPGPRGPRDPMPMGMMPPRGPRPMLDPMMIITGLQARGVPPMVIAQQMAALQQRGLIPPPNQGMPMGMMPRGPRGPRGQPARGAPESAVFKQKDFPSLGMAPKGGEDEGDKPIGEPAQPAQPTQPQQPPVRPRMEYNNPTAGPIPGVALASSLMEARDITYVVNGMLRGTQMDDPFRQDHYYVNYEEGARASVAQALGGLIPPQFMPSTPLPAPIFVKRKIEKAEHDRKYKLDKRSKKWEDDKSVLGHTSKSDVNKPRALLAIPTLKQESSELKDEEEKLRNELWAARVLIDKGMIALLDLQELQRIIKDEKVGPDIKQRLMGGVKTHIGILERCVGITTKQVEEGGRGGGRSFDKDALKSVLKMPKGVQLVARSIETGILPHSSALEILPDSLAEILGQMREENVSASKVEMEERLLTAFERGIITIARPAIPASALKDVVRSVCARHEGENTMKDAIASGRRRAEIMHTIMKRGGEICKGDEEWDNLEEGFIIMLKQQ